MRRVLAVLLIAALSAACSGKTDDAGEVALAAENVEAKKVYGEISEVIGNAIIIKEMEIPEMREFMPPDMTEFTLPDGTVVPFGEDGMPDFSGIDLNSLDLEGMLPEGFSMQRVNERMDEMGIDLENFNPGEVFGERTRGSGERRIVEGGEGFSRLAERLYTGEEVEVFVPVGLPITTMTREDGQFIEKELNLNQLKAGDIITVTYKPDGEAIESVSVTQGGFGGGLGMFNVDMIPGGEGGFFYANPQQGIRIAP